MLIYLDTNLWNAFCDQRVDPATLLTSLNKRNAHLVLGTHNFYELAKTFEGGREGASERGRELFAYLVKFFEANVLCAKDNMEILAAEMYAVKQSIPVDAFLGRQDRVSFGKKVKAFAEGMFGEIDTHYIEQLVSFASNTRQNQILHLEEHADIKARLKGVSPANLTQWMRKQVFSAAGLEQLARHVQGRFPEITANKATEDASGLLSLPARRISRGLILADLYYNWRCACRESNPKDLVDDMQHILNAVYCDTYATGDTRQTEYAELLLTSNTRVNIYRAEMPVDEWLHGLVTESLKGHRNSDRR
jgi:hypothetical protein